MTRRRELEDHLHMLDEIRNIMSSMKTLAYMETRKLNRFLENQHKMVSNIEDMAADFVSTFPETLPAKEATTNIFLLIGSERGFCGNFNESLLPVLESCLAETETPPVIVTIGHKLHNILEQDSRVISAIDGASVAEEIGPVLSNIADTLVRLQTTYPSLSLYGIYHAEKHGGTQTGNDYQVIMQKLLPPFQNYLGADPVYFIHPEINITPADFLLELTDQYLLASLHEILYTSLMAENHRRMQHLEGAVQHMDEKADELTGICNALRQEEIIEEIEVILLNTAGLEEQPGTQ